MPYDIILTASASGELKQIRVFDRRKIVDEMETQLTHEPKARTRNRKPLEIDPDFEHEPPVWELRVGGYRVFYDVNESESRIYVRAIRQKRHGQTTEDIIHERSDS